MNRVVVALVFALLGVASASAQQGPVVVVETTKGAFAFETYPSEAPKTVAHILQLVRDSFYDGQRFHRALPGSGAWFLCLYLPVVPNLASLKLLPFRFEIQYSAATAITAIAANCRHRHPVDQIPESIQTQTSLKTANNNPDRTTQFETTVRTVSRRLDP